MLTATGCWSNMTKHCLIDLLIERLRPYSTVVRLLGLGQTPPPADKIMSVQLHHDSFCLKLLLSLSSLSLCLQKSQCHVAHIISDKKHK